MHLFFCSGNVWHLKWDFLIYFRMKITQYSSEIWVYANVLVCNDTRKIDWQCWGENTLLQEQKSKEGLVSFPNLRVCVRNQLLLWERVSCPWAWAAFRPLVGPAPGPSLRQCWVFWACCRHCACCPVERHRSIWFSDWEDSVTSLGEGGTASSHLVSSNHF